jgi:methylmalonyl-CoA mutase N-terminal domain/subunit
VGVNAFQMDEPVRPERLRVDPAVEAAQASRLAALRTRRDAGRVGEMLSRLEAAARGQENLMPHFIESVEADLTLGEICGVLRRVWGEYRAPATI